MTHYPTAMYIVEGAELPSAETTERIATKPAGVLAGHGDTAGFS